VLHFKLESAPITLPVGETFRSAGRLEILIGEREYLLDADMEYVLWPNGVFGPQRKYKNYRASGWR
jgi:hypothetical protein